MIKIIVICIVLAVLIIYLRSINSELSTLALIGAGIIVISVSFEYLSNTFDFFNNIIQMTGISNEMYSVIFKITAIGYLIEFGADTISDFGLNSLANKLVFVGKLIILSVSLPILYALFNLLTELFA